MKKRVWSILLVGAMCVLLGGCGGNAPGADSNAEKAEQTAKEEAVETKVVKLAHTASEDSAYQVMCQKFADLVNERTDGAILIEIYPNGQLGNDNDVFEALQTNAIQFDCTGYDHMANYIPDVDVLNLPFLFKDEETAFRILDSDVVAELFSGIENEGVYYLATGNAGFRHLQTVDTAVNTIDDIKGLKIRVPDGEMFMAIWDDIGTNPTPTAYSETYMALQTGVVDGVELPLNVFLTSGFGELCKNFAYLNYRIQAPGIYVSQIFYDSLTEEQQQVIDAAAKEACEYEREWMSEAEAAYQTQCEEEYGVSFTAPELDLFREACQPLYDEFENQELLAQILEIAGE